MHLIACTSCRRPYDVTRLEPGSHVRCICDALLEVTQRVPLSVAALCCKHCGGAVGPDDPACGYCGAALSAEDRTRATLCPYCYTRLADDSRHCNQCGSDITPQALEPLPVDMVDGRGVPRGCPRCRGELRVRVVGALDVIECGDCAGLWFEPTRFDDVCRQAREGRGAELFASSAPPVAVEDAAQGYIPCLRCGELMLRRQFQAGGRYSGVVTDVCKDHGVWLDASEIERIVGFLRTAADAPHGHGGHGGTGGGSATALPEGAFGAATLPRSSGSFLPSLLGTLGEFFVDQLF